MLPYFWQDMKLIVILIFLNKQNNIPTISTILSVSFTSFSVFINTLLILTLCDTVAQKPEAQDQEFLGHVWSFQVHMFLREGNKRQKKIFDNVFGTCAWGWLKPQWKLEAAAEYYARKRGWIGERSSLEGACCTTTASSSWLSLLCYTTSRTTYHPRTTTNGTPRKNEHEQTFSIGSTTNAKNFQEQECALKPWKKKREVGLQREFSASLPGLFSLCPSTILDRKFNVSQFEIAL